MLNGYISFLKTNKRGEAEPGETIAVHEKPVPFNAEDFSELKS